MASDEVDIEADENYVNCVVNVPGGLRFYSEPMGDAAYYYPTALASFVFCAVRVDVAPS